eukprot:TRINITY_DN12187_c0_g2_i1.p1 TRINITY_DN12187_c0_g2~~TRINITY_DN12187_c0_g2_i1.p1  ORF type:complete len:1112 (-),score=276.26 TRINITY_DN12187_c0_g2_i1:193-3528(-)
MSRPVFSNPFGAAGGAAPPPSSQPPPQGYAGASYPGAPPPAPATYSAPPPAARPTSVPPPASAVMSPASSPAAPSTPQGSRPPPFGGGSGGGGGAGPGQNAPPSSVLSPSGAAGGTQPYSPSASYGTPPPAAARVAPPPSQEDVARRQNAESAAPSAASRPPPAAAFQPAPAGGGYPGQGHAQPPAGYPQQPPPQQQQQHGQQWQGQQQPPAHGSGYPQQHPHAPSSLPHPNLPPFHPANQRPPPAGQLPPSHPPPQQHGAGYPPQQVSGGYPPQTQPHHPPHQPHQQQQHQQQHQQQRAPSGQPAYGGQYVNANAGRPQGQGHRIDPHAIPSPVATVQAAYEAGAPAQFHTRVNQQPPPPDVPFVTVDEGNAGPRFLRPTTYTLPVSRAVAEQCRLPLGVVVQPLAEPQEGEEPVPVVDMGACGPVRCTRCRAYANPFDVFMDGGRASRCSLCGHINQVPQDYFCPTQPNGMRMDLAHRPELTRGVVDIAATHEYMLRTPSPLGTVFLIDVSAPSLNCGLLHTLVTSIRSILQSLPESSPQRFAIVTYDDTLHFYNIKPGSTQPQMMVVPDLENPFLPVSAESLLVPYHESKAAFDSLLELLPQIFEGNRAPGSAFGSAVNAAGLLLKDTGGKLVAFQHSLPACGSGKLENRLQQQQRLVAGKDGAFFQPQVDFYKMLGETLADAQIGVDVFVFANDYVDVATISDLCKFTGGEMYFFPRFSANQDRVKLHNELHRNVTRTQGYEGIMRVRVGNGLQVQHLVGDMVRKRGFDMEVATISCDKSFVVTMEHDGVLEDTSQGGGESVIQSALLYTSSDGQRRIRLCTLSLQTTPNAAQVFRSADLSAVFTINTRLSVQRLLSNEVAPVRKQLVESCVSTLCMYRKHCSSAGTGSGQLILPESLKLLPVLTLAFMKHPAMRPESPVDERAYWRTKLGSMSMSTLLLSVYPKMVPIHRLPPPVLLKNGLEITPPTARLMSSLLEQQGVYLISTGLRMFLWLGRAADSNVLQQLFGVPSMQELGSKFTFVSPEESELSARVRRLIRSLQSESPIFQQLHIVKQGEASERGALQLFVEDGRDENMAMGENEFYEHVHQLSYVAFLCRVHRKVQAAV